MSTVFWSWQSDLDARVTRNVIRDSLAAAIDQLQTELEERHELTSDTQGIAGWPDIVATILAKIDAAAVFVGDVTPIAISAAGKAVANPNVLIELGYAKKALGLTRVILVWNTAFEGATVEQLPFDMRGRRAPMDFHLLPGATTAELRTAREGLTRRLREALKASIAASTPPTVRAPAEWQGSDPSTPALWFDPATAITINEDGVPGTKAVHPAPHAYVRILPASWTVPPHFGEGRLGHPALLGPTEGFSWGATKGGFITYSGSLRSSAAGRPIANLAMQFRSNGEIWGVSSFVTNENGDSFYADAFINHAHDFIEANVAYLVKQGAAGPFHVRLGITGLAGRHWVTDARWGGRPVALEPRVEATLTLNGAGEEERLAALEPAWGEIAAAFGVTQPPRAVLIRQIRGF
ncbi:hypothetical protein [Sphingomonas aquatilis]|uniref:hypothetical protein n=1 Tax=Sphingomonas aquatilis TaxID=93063 RepID=UPI0023F9B8BC|nr:hypothetical protein [Sphingomonas aquatilis]MCI4654672.1 nucleotide-binding protein [Sphingomonas aquatilis]